MGIKDLIAFVDRPEWLPLGRPPTIRILMVVDGAVDLEGYFSIGMVIDLLRNETIGFVNLDVTLATRDGAAATDDSATDSNKLPYYRGFRFDRMDGDAPAINRFDQIWCFGFHPGNDGNTSDDPITNHPTAVTDSELKMLTTWMNEKKGGVFATGDHHYLGASMCSRIPRVGTMRRWTNAQGVPTFLGYTRYDTNRPQNSAQSAGLAEIPSDLSFGSAGPHPPQSDAIPQRIEWKQYQISNSYFFQTYGPHPLLCSPHGPINILPDHPHEGEVIPDADVVTNRTYNFGGYSGDEYPTLSGVKPVPEIIAWANTLGDPPVIHEKGDTPARRFGVIGVYDGQRAGVGRVVVDSTWHHWMDTNLYGLHNENGTEWKKLKWYFQNVALWLATEAQRMRMLTAATWLSHFTIDAIEHYSSGISAAALGKNVKDILGRFAPPCTVREWTRPFLEQAVREPRFPRPDPCLTCPPFEWMEWNILGEIVRSQMPQARKLIAARRSGDRRKKLDWSSADDAQLLKVTLDAGRRGRAAAQKQWFESLETTAKELKADIERVEPTMSDLIEEEAGKSSAI